MLTGISFVVFPFRGAKMCYMLEKDDMDSRGDGIEEGVILSSCVRREDFVDSSPFYRHAE